MITNRLRGRNIYVIREPMLIRILNKQFVKYIRRDLALQFLLRSFSKGDLDSILPCQLASKEQLFTQNSTESVNSVFSIFSSFIPKYF